MSLKAEVKRIVGHKSSLPAGASRIVEFRGARILCAESNKLEAKLLTDPKGYDESNFEALCAIVREGSVCLDIGANIGIYSSVMSRIVGDAGAVHAFEPVRHIRRKLASNVAINGGRNVVINDFALGAEPGELEMFQVKEGQYRAGTSTFLNNNNVQDMGVEAFDRELVKIVTLDSYAADMPKIDFIKLDVEGFELNVLRGGRETLARCKPAILFEHDQPRLAGLGLVESDFATLLNELGYSCFEVFPADDETYFAPFGWDRKLKRNNVLALQLGK